MPHRDQQGRHSLAVAGRKQSRESAHVSLEPIERTVADQACGAMQRMPASSYMHSEHAQCVLHSSGAPAAESQEALPRLPGSQTSSFLARTHVMIDFKRL